MATQWRPLAACLGAGVPLDEFIPDDRHVCGPRCASPCGASDYAPPTRRAREVCASCPVAVYCVDEALRQHLQGLRGDLTLNTRRILASYAATAGHPYTPGCSCRYCTALPLLVTHKARIGSGNGPRVTHGNRSTYARRCRCTACSHASATADRHRRWSKPAPISDVDPAGRPCPHNRNGCAACEHQRQLEALAA